MTDQERQLNAKRRSLYTRVLAATDWPAMKEFAASRIEMHRNEMEECSAEDLPKIQGRIAELRYLARADDDIRARLAHLPKDAAE
jgi:hypothetical protein